MNLLVLTLMFISTPSNVTAGDEAFYRIDYSAAIAAYESELKASPDDPELLWRLSRVYVCTGEVLENGEALAYFRRAEEYARRCLAIHPSHPQGHTWMAATLGYLALHAGMKEQVALSNRLYDEIQRAIALDANNDAAYSILGSLYRALGNVSWVQRQLAAVLFGPLPEGGFEEGEKALQKAIALAPDVMRHHYELGVLYLDWGRTEDARAALRTAELLPVRVAIDRPRLAKVKSLLSMLTTK